MIRAALVLLLGATPAAAQEADVTCAALWLGYADFARVSAYLDIGDADRQAARHRAMAIRAGLSPKDADRQIDAQRGGMFLLVRATVEDDDPLSRQLFERQMQLCAG
ncbi:hypothetical protein [Puniceibacterium sediminis]|uniref:Uncharacterized protein n=1 Tax=Puniceibacterium sediminis TaxID=1608407 RepID=A0A238UXN9_9RHOB|nr:hypothetical protein [Puniceibacterium sediminis]SNR26681.1 hypothetical protein SAMN06265370_101272 [Puniceibacterium sediminis]